MMFLFGKIRMLWAWDYPETFEIYDSKKLGKIGMPQGLE